MIREALLTEISAAATKTALQLVEDEVERLLGKPWSPKGDNQLRRGGSCKGRIFLNGEPTNIKRPRVRDTETGTEYPLETVQVLSSREAFDEEVMQLMALGVSTRQYDKALSKIADGLGLQKSGVSSAFKPSIPEGFGCPKRALSW